MCCTSIAKVNIWPPRSVCSRVLVSLAQLDEQLKRADNAQAGLVDAHTGVLEAHMRHAPEESAVTACLQCDIGELEKALVGGTLSARTPQSVDRFTSAPPANRHATSQTPWAQVRRSEGAAAEEAAQVAPGRTAQQAAHAKDGGGVRGGQDEQGKQRVAACLPAADGAWAKRKFAAPCRPPSPGAPAPRRKKRKAAPSKLHFSPASEAGGLEHGLPCSVATPTGHPASLAGNLADSFMRTPPSGSVNAAGTPGPSCFRLPRSRLPEQLCRRSACWYGRGWKGVGRKQQRSS